MSEATTSATETQAEEKLKVNRREFLNLAWLASLGFFVLEVGGVTVLFAYPRFKEGEFGGIFTFGKVSDLPKDGEAPANFPKVKLWLSKTDEGLVALYKVCPHLGCLYGWADVTQRFECPCHGSKFTPDGEFVSGPAPRSLDRFKIIATRPDGSVLETPADGSAIQLSGDETLAIDTGTRIAGKKAEKAT